MKVFDPPLYGFYDEGNYHLKYEGWAVYNKQIKHVFCDRDNKKVHLYINEKIKAGIKLKKHDTYIIKIKNYNVVNFLFNTKTKEMYSVS